MTFEGKDVIKVGPWPGGMNARDQDKASEVVNPKQLRWIKNFDVLDSGVLQSRLGCRKVLSTAPIYGGTSINLIGSILESTHLYALVGKVTAGPVTTFYYTEKPEDAAAGWIIIATAQTGTFTDVFKYNNVIYFIQAVGGAGTAQSRATVTAGAWTAQPNIPKGDQVFVVKDRVFVVDWAASTIYWSKATDPTTWTAPDGGSSLISPGDGENINKVVFINNSIYIFKRNKTFLFTFNTDPAIDGQVTPLSTVRGAYDAIVYNNEVYIVNDQSVFKLVNNYFSDIGLAADIYVGAGLDAMFDPLSRLFIEAGDKLVVGPVNIVNPSQLFSHYAMNLKTGAWSYRFYDDAVIRPQADVRKKSIPWRNPATAAGSSTGNIYCSATNIVSYTRFKSYNLLDIQANTLDVNSAEHTISPEYSMITHEIIPNNSYPEWKRCYLITSRHYADIDSFTDASVTYNLRLGPDLFTVGQSVIMPLSTNFFTVEKEAKLGFQSFRFKSLSIVLVKNSQDLGTIVAKSPDSNSLVILKSLELIVGANRRQISEAVNA